MDRKVLKWNFIFQYGYVITNIINSIILLPFYLKMIDAGTLGVWLATGNILAWMTLVDPGVGEVLQQKIADLRGRNENEEICKTIGSGLLASGIILLIAVVAGFIFYSLIGIIINKDVTLYPHLQVALLISIISTGMSLTSFSMSGINQGMHNASQVAISSILSNMLFLAINIVLLVLHFGILSIAIANLSRALFINIYNLVALEILLKKNAMKINFEVVHFKRFIKIFSVTSVSRIIGGLSASMDTIVLARFISPAMITLFEINKRPIQLTQSLVGRHSVALMPNISFAFGKNERDSILGLINTQFKYYMLASIFIGMLFWFNYRDIITTWTGKGHYAGDTVIYLLIGNFFFGLIGYFMSNMGYALGDIKMNSFIYIIKGLIIGVLFYISARYYGIPGILTVMLAGNILIDFFLFSQRLYKLGFLEMSMIKRSLRLGITIIPLLFLAGAACNYMVKTMIAPGLPLITLLLNGSMFSLFFISIVLMADPELRTAVSALLKGLPFNPFPKKEALLINKRL